MPATNDFIYLESMQELASWRPESASQHCSNISNTPLTPRPLASNQATDKLPPLLLCHDYKGSYHPTEASQGQFNTVSNAAYTAEHLSLASHFCYFSHKRVTIPPAPWINVCHRNGLKVLGTFLLEHAEDTQDASRLFERGSEGEFLFATQLVRLAKTYGFDGWLLNFESRIPGFRPSLLQEFLKDMKGQGIEVIYYDALTVLNLVHYQNGVTLLNAPMLSAASGLMTNYWWRSGGVLATKVVAGAMGRKEDVWMGIDCYGRGSMGDGGYGTKIPLQVLRENGGGMGAALFAPGWTWENFDGKDFETVEKKFWKGVSEHVQRVPSGTKDGFYTNFNRGFGNGFWTEGRQLCTTSWVHLGLQSLLPTYPDNWVLSNEKVYSGAWSLSLDSPGTHPLYSLGIKLHPTLVFYYTFQCTYHPTQNAEPPTIGVTILLQSGEKIRRFEPLVSTDGWQTSELYLGDYEGTIIDLDVIRPPSFRGDLFLGELLITSMDDRLMPSTISKVYTKEKSGESKKLKWNVYPRHNDEVQNEKRKKAGYWSEQTGDYAHFLVIKGGEMKGVAFQNEWVLPEGETEEGWEVRGVTWEGKVCEGN